MKRWIGGLLALALCFAATLAAATLAAAREAAVAAAPEGTAILRFMGYGFQIAVPLDWHAEKINKEERKRSGVVFIAQNDAGDQKLTVLRREEKKKLTADKLLERARETDPAAEIVEINGVQLVRSGDGENRVFYANGLWDYEAETLVFQIMGDERIAETILSAFEWLEKVNQTAAQEKQKASALFVL